MNFTEYKKGFTLIELLVVISIISLLSSIVFTALNGAKIKAKDAAVKQGVVEFAKLLELEYMDTGRYDALQKGSWAPETQCVNVPFTGNYAAQAKDICNSITTNALVTASDKEAFISYNYSDLSQTYSVMAKLNSGKWFCVGKSGTSEPNWYSGSPQPVGCPYNP